MFDLSAPATYLHFGVILISIPNLVVILAMIAVFALAMLLPMPGRHAEDGGER